MKIQNFLMTAILAVSMLALSTGLKAQCGPSNAPSIEIPDIDIKEGTSARIPIIGHNLDGSLYWTMSFCASGHPGIYVTGVYNKLNGQWVNLDLNGKVTLSWGSYSDECIPYAPNFTGPTVLAEIEVYAAPLTPVLSTSTIALCNNAPSSPSNILYCNGNTLHDVTPPSCSGTVTVRKRLFKMENLSTSMEEELDAFPSPFRDELTLQLPLDVDGDAEVSVYDLSGKLVYEGAHKLQSGLEKVDLDTSTWPSGTLVLRVVSSEKQIVKRIVHQ